MNTILKLFLSMSFSGSLLILLLFLGKRFLKNKISRQWQYYIWLVVLIRLLLPFGSETNLMGKLYQTIDQAITQAIYLPQSPNISEMLDVPNPSPNISDMLDVSNPSPNVSDMLDVSNPSPNVSDMLDVPNPSPNVSEMLDVSNPSPNVSEMLDVPNSSPNILDALDIPNSTAIDLEFSNQDTDISTEIVTVADLFQDMIFLLAKNIWFIWLLVALILLIRKITIYQSFIWYVNTGLTAVSDIEILDQLSILTKQAGIKKPIELGSNPLVSSPLLIGFFHPYIVLPSTDISEKDFPYIILHELIHCKRRDLFYKWLVQIAVCLHWFNPFVHLMSREIAKACEFSCDEAVLSKIGYDHAQDYGKTLLHAMAAVGKYKESFGTVTLSGKKHLLKERLGAIMSCKKKSKTIRFFTGILTLCIFFGAFFIGIYPAASAGDLGTVGLEKSLVGGSLGTVGLDESLVGGGLGTVGLDESLAAVDLETMGSNSSIVLDRNEKGLSPTWEEQAEWYYKAKSLPLFEVAFSRLDKETQGTWMDRIYADKQLTFFSVCINQLDIDSPLIQQFAEKFYQDYSINFFSILMSKMSEETLEAWLHRALEDRYISLQSILFDELNWEEEKDALEAELAAKQRKEYKEHDITEDGINYYYQGQLVNLFLDQHSNRSNPAGFTLNINPAGTVNIRIIRNADGKITGVSCMTEAEIMELLGGFDESSKSGDKKDSDDDWADKERDFDWSWKDQKEKTQIETYAAWGITQEGKSYYYQGNLVNVFFDLRPDSSFYTLNIDPKGTVNIKVIRNKNSEITGISYMTKEEARELLDDR